MGQVDRWQASPSNPAKQEHSPVTRLQRPLPEHSALACAAVAEVGRSPQERPEGQVPIGQEKTSRRINNYGEGKGKTLFFFPFSLLGSYSSCLWVFGVIYTCLMEMYILYLYYVCTLNKRVEQSGDA